MNVRAKFALQEHIQRCWHHGHVQHEFLFRAQYDQDTPENQRFAKATPNGEMRVTVDNPDVVEVWSKLVGRQFYLDFTLVPHQP